MNGLPPLPPLARRYLRAALVYLVVGVLTGLHMSTAVHLGMGEMHFLYISAHTHVLLVGAGLTSAFGLALWLLPPPARPTPLRARVPGVAWWLLALGVAGRYLLETWLGYRPQLEGLRAAIVAVSTVETLAVVAMAVALWPRVRGADA